MLTHNSELKIRPKVNPQLGFEPIVLTVPFNTEVSQKLYPAILGFINLLEVFRVVIASDKEGKHKIFGLLASTYAVTR